MKPIIHNYVKSLTFNEFVKSGLYFTDKLGKEDLFLITNYYYQSSWIYDNNNDLLIDTIIRHENIETELKEFLLENNVEKEIINDLDFDTKINNTNIDDYTQFYNKELIEWIYIFIPDFVDDLKRLNYSFSKSNPNPSK